MKRTDPELISSMTRRSFLIGGTSLLGWLVQPRIARKIIHLAEEHGRILDVPIARPIHTLYAKCSGILTLDGFEDDEVPVLTWREWIEVKGYDADSADSIYQCFVDHCLCEPWEDFDAEYSDPEDFFRMPILADEIPKSLMWDYLDGEFSTTMSPSARAFDFLEQLDLGVRVPNERYPLGELRFVDGACPGNDSKFVEATSLETISGLQQRLIQLGQNVRVELVGG